MLDQAFGAASRLDELAGSELPPLERQHRMSFDAIYGLAGRDYNSNSSRHGEFVSEIVYDMAPGATYWFINYHSPDEFGQAVDYITNVLRPKIVVHSNSFLFGRFDGTGWFARKVDAAAAAGMLWVNSAGNYRTRHWEGAWSDADGDGNLDVPGDGNAFRVDLCDHAARPATSRGPARRATPATTTRSRSTRTRADDAVIDKNTHQPIKSDGLDRAAGSARLDAAGRDLLPRPLLRGGAARGQSPHDRLTLYCRMDLSPTAQVTASSSPTPGDAVGAFSVGAIDATTLLPESYSSEGPTDDGRNKPDIAAPTNVLITPGRSRGGSGQRLRRHLLRDPPRRRRGGAALAERRRRRRRRAAWRSGCATGSSPRRSTWARPAPTASSARAACASISHAPVLGAPKPAPNALVRGTVALALPVAMRARSACMQLTADGKPLVATLDPGGVLQASWPTAGLRRGRTPSTSSPPTRAATARPTTHAARRQPGAARAPARARSARARAPRCASRPPCSTSAAAWRGGR